MFQPALVLRAPLAVERADASPPRAPEPIWRLLATAVFAAAAALSFAAVVILGAPGDMAPDAQSVVMSFTTAAR